MPHDPGLYSHSATIVPFSCSVFDSHSASDAIVDQYNRDGYIVLDASRFGDQVKDLDVALTNLVTGLNRPFAEAVRQRVQSADVPKFSSGNKTPWVQYESGTTLCTANTNAPSILLTPAIADSARKLMGFVGYEPSIDAVVNNPHLTSFAARLLECNREDIELFQDMALLKPACGGREKPWHQDKAYFDLDVNSRVVGCWMAIDEATVDNGCLRFERCGHKNGPRMHYAIRDYQLCDTLVASRKEVVAVPLLPGEFVLFDGMIPHGTPTNISQTSRRALQFHWIDRRNAHIVEENEPGVGRAHVFGGTNNGLTC